MEDLQKFKQYVKENGAWVCNCKSPYFQTNEEIKCLMCHSIKNVLLIFQEKFFFLGFLSKHLKSIDMNLILLIAIFIYDNCKYLII